MKIKETLTKVPGGMMLFPLLIGAIIRTLFPHLFDQTVFKTSFTGGLLTGTAALLAAFYVCLGSTIEFKATGYILKKGLALWVGKILTAFILAFLIKAIAPDQNHLILGWSALAVIAASSTAGNAAAVPVSVAAVFMGYKKVAATATLQVTAAVIVTAILTPLITVWYAKRVSVSKENLVSAKP